VLPHVEAIAGASRVETVIFLRVVEAFYPAEGMGFTFGPAEIRRIEAPRSKAARSFQCKELFSIRVRSLNPPQAAGIGLAVHFQTGTNRFPSANWATFQQRMGEEDKNYVDKKTPQL
jgi:hypothetical protein